MPVKKEKYWKVEDRGTEISIYWIPIVSASGSSGFIPDEYIGGESVTFPNGLIMKHGYKVCAFGSCSGTSR